MGALKIDEKSIRAIRDMEREIGEEVLKDLVRIHVGTSPAALVALRKSVEVGDVAQTKAVAHKLKSSFGLLGLLRMYELCRELEINAGDSRRDLPRVAEIEELYEQSIPALKRLADGGSL